MERRVGGSSLTAWMENPLQGFFNRERTVLVFRQRSLEAQAAVWSLVGGGLMALYGFWGLFVSGDAMGLWFALFGTAFAAAGGWAFLLFRYLRFDLRKRTYMERSGMGFWVRWRTGGMDEINCLGLEAYHGLIPEM